MAHMTTVLTGAKQIAVSERSLPELVPDGHVRLRLAMGSLCGTDLHYYKHFSNAGFRLQHALTLGHEACAYVSDPGESAFEIGQLVALNPIIACHACVNCLAGKQNHCLNKNFPGSATSVPHINGFFQAAFDFPATCCHAVREGTEPRHLTFAEPLACAMHAVRLGEINRGDRVLVTGCGPMGLLAILAVRATGATVDASDIRSHAVKLAEQIGAERGFTVKERSPRANNYDVVIEASGSPHGFNQALESARRMGRVSILSNIQMTDTPIHLHRIMLKEVRVFGSFQFNDEFAEALNFVTSAGGNLEPLISARFPLAQAGAAFAHMAAGEAAGKILIEPES